MTDSGSEEKPASRKTRVGSVISNKMDKTVVVRVERRFAHPRFRKYVRSFKKYHAHDETNSLQIGDVVRIEETRPLSKLKRWKFVDMVRENVEARR